MAVLDAVRRGAAHRPAGRDLRTRLAGVDPGLARLHLASVAVASMLLAVGVTEVLRRTLAPDEPVTVLLFAGALAMFATIAVNEPDLARRRTTTALMALPAVAATAVGTLLAPTRVVAAVVFVAVMMGAVWVRRWGPRGFALGMAAFMPFFFTQFLRVQVGQLPWLVVAVGLGLGSTLLLRGVLLAENPARTLRRLVAAFRARAHALLDAVDDVLAGLDPPVGPADPAAVERMRRARLRLNEVALLVEDQLEHSVAERVWPGLDNGALSMRVFDAELALERLAVAVRRLTEALGVPAGAAGPVDDGPLTPDAVPALRAGVGRLAAAVSPSPRPAEVLADVAAAREAVADLVADVRPGGERAQRVAFAVRRVADALEHAQRDAPARPVPAGPPTPAPAPPAPASPASSAPGPDHDDAATARDDPRPDDPRPDDPRADGDTDGDSGSGTGARADGGLALSTRHAVQVGVATSLAILGGELLAPSRWYWAVIAAFVVFGNTASRGDLLSRSWGRVLGTVGGVAAGMALALLVAGHPVWSLVALFVCVFLAVYLVRVSPALLAFWITAVLALVYGLIGQFSVQVLVLRIEETVVGVVASVLAAFLVLPRRTRAAFGDAVGEFVDLADTVLAGAVDALLGTREDPRPTLDAREMDDALARLRLRARPLDPPVLTGTRRRGRSGRDRGVRTLGVVDHYVRSLARLSDTVEDPSWASALRPAAERVRANLGALGDVLARGGRGPGGERRLARSAESLVDAAEEHAARTLDPRRRTDLLTVARLLRRVDQAVVALASDLGAADDAGPAQPSSASSAGLANTPSGS